MSPRCKPQFSFHAPGPSLGSAAASDALPRFAMFRRKLKALEYHHPDSFDVNDEEQLRNLIVWLEDQKIRLYKIEDRADLRDVKSAEWSKAFSKYLKELQCPVDVTLKPSVVDWILAHAVRLEYTENAEDYNSVQQYNGHQAGKILSAEKSLDSSLLNLAADNPDLKAGVMSLARLLSLPEHEDHFVLLQAIRTLIEKKLATEKVKNSKIMDNSEDVISLATADLGFDTTDVEVNEAAKILRLLHISQLRELQTRINEAIVAVQAITADPKTDQSLGKLGVIGK